MRPGNRGCSSSGRGVSPQVPDPGSDAWLSLRNVLLYKGLASLGPVALGAVSSLSSGTWHGSKRSDSLGEAVSFSHAQPVSAGFDHRNATHGFGAFLRSRSTLLHRSDVHHQRPVEQRPDTAANRCSAVSVRLTQGAETNVLPTVTGPEKLFFEQMFFSRKVPETPLFFSPHAKIRRWRHE